MCFRKNDLDKYLSVSDLKINLVPITPEIRKKFHICIIDDQSYIKEGFEKLGFENVDVQTKVKKLVDYSKYQIILCDIKGVGTDLSENQEGYAFAKELADTYPGIEVLIFTGQNIKNYTSLVELEVIEKPKNKAELAKIFDKCIKKLMNPVSLWAKLYKYLTINNLSAKDIVILEDRFVRSLKNKNSFDFGGLSISLNNSKETLENIGIVLGTAAAAFTKELCNQ